METEKAQIDVNLQLYHGKTILKWSETIFNHIVDIGFLCLMLSETSKEVLKGFLIVADTA